MLQCHLIMRANGPRALIKSSLLHPSATMSHEGLRDLRYVPLAPQKLEDTDQNFWCCKTDHIFSSCHKNSIFGNVENMTSLVYLSVRP